MHGVQVVTDLHHGIAPFSVVDSGPYRGPRSLCVRPHTTVSSEGCRGCWLGTVGNDVAHFCGGGAKLYGISAVLLVLIGASLIASTNNPVRHTPRSEHIFRSPQMHGGHHDRGAQRARDAARAVGNSIVCPRRRARGRVGPDGFTPSCVSLCLRFQPFHHGLSGLSDACQTPSLG